MEISNSFFYIILMVIFLGISLPGLKAYYLDKKKKIHLYIWVILGAVVTAFFAIVIPQSTIVTDCGEYTTKRLLLPKDEYSYGENEYIENKSNSYLHIKHIPYGDVDLEKMPEDVVIAPGSVHKLKGSIDYYFEESPDFINTKGKGVIKKVLYCFDEEEFLEERFEN